MGFTLGKLPLLVVMTVNKNSLKPATQGGRRDLRPFTVLVTDNLNKKVSVFPGRVWDAYNHRRLTTHLAVGEDDDGCMLDSPWDKTESKEFTVDVGDVIYIGVFHDKIGRFDENIGVTMNYAFLGLEGELPDDDENSFYIEIATIESEAEFLTVNQKINSDLWLWLPGNDSDSEDISWTFPKGVRLLKDIQFLIMIRPGTLEPKLLK
jgi:hypothetical protein